MDIKLIEKEAREYADCKKWRNSNPEFVNGKYNECAYDCQFCDTQCEYLAYVKSATKFYQLALDEIRKLICDNCEYLNNPEPCHDDPQQADYCPNRNLIFKLNNLSKEVK